MKERAVSLLKEMAVVSVHRFSTRPNSFKKLLNVEHEFHNIYHELTGHE